jgi:hypothetical protein
MGVTTCQDLLDPACQEAVAGPKLRTVSTPAAGSDPSALAAQSLARQQQQHPGMAPANTMVPAPGHCGRCWNSRCCWWTRLSGWAAVQLHAGACLDGARSCAAVG